MSVKEKMTNVANAIRGLTSNIGPLSLNNMVIWLAKLTGYDISNVELSRITSDDKFTIMAESIRHATSVTRKLSLDSMADILNAVVASDGKALYNTLEDAIVACDAGGTVTLLRDIDVGTLCNVRIDKDITIDGKRRRLTGKFKGSPFFEIGAKVGSFNLKNLNAVFTADGNISFEDADAKGFVHISGNYGSCNVMISECNLKSVGNIAHVTFTGGNFCIENSVLETNVARTLLFSYGYNQYISLKNCEIYANTKSDAHAIQVYGGTTNVLFDDVRMDVTSGVALGLRYCEAGTRLCIKNSDISVYDSTLGAVDIHNCDPVVDLTGSTKIWIQSDVVHASIRMRGSQNCDPIITLYDNVTLTDGVRSPIYYTTYAYRTGFHVKFADSYQSAKYLVLSTTDNTKNCQVWLENNPAIAFSHGGEAVYTCKLEYALEAQSKLGNLQFQYIDAEGRWRLTIS